MKSLIFFIIIFFSALHAQSKEKTHTVYQIGKQFVAEMSDKNISKMKNSKGKFKKSEVKKHILRKLKIKVNDEIKFVNKDNVEHNVFGQGFDYNQKNGDENVQKFTEPGTKTIRCAIHPKMKFKVIVEK